MNWIETLMTQIPNFRKEFGARVKQLRKQKHLSQKALAAKTEIRFQQLNKYESGLNTPPLETLIKLAVALETTADFLLTGEYDPQGSLHNKRLLKRLEALEQFNTDDQEAVIRLLDAMIFKDRIHGTLSYLKINEDTKNQQQQAGG